MDAFIKLYDWTADIEELNLEERVIFSLIHQFTEYHGEGFWGGITLLATRTRIPKSRCKYAIAKLLQMQAITQHSDKIKGVPRTILRTNPQFTDNFCG